MGWSKIFQARTVHNSQHLAHNRTWTEKINSFSNRPAHGPLNNWQTWLFFPPEAKYLPWLFCLQRQNIWADAEVKYLSWLFCLQKQNVYWNYFAFCETWLVEVVKSSCDKHDVQNYMLQLVCKPNTPNLKPQT